MPFFRYRLLVIHAVFACAVTGPCATGEEGSADIVRELTGRWIATERAIAEEQKIALERKSRLIRLIALRKAEIADLEAGETTPTPPSIGAEALRLELAEEEGRLAGLTESVRARLPALERKLTSLMPRLPPPLREALSPQARAIAAPSGADATVAERIRVVTSALREIETFEQQSALHTEVVTLEDGEELYVHTLYLGTAAAFFVDESGKAAGRGFPGPASWVWKRESAIADAVLQAVTSLAAERKDTPLIPLPLEIDPAK